MVIVKQLVALCALIAVSSAPFVHAEERIQAGFSLRKITPSVEKAGPVWLAGYTWGRDAKGVHDDLFARGVVLRHGGRKIAMVSVDLVGYPLPEVELIRRQLKGFDFVMVSSTHNHNGPDTIGIWGRTPLHRGADDRYLGFLRKQIVELILEAEQKAKPVQAAFGIASDNQLLEDSRLPRVYDASLRAIQLTDANGKPAGIIMQWNCHPECLGPKNHQITADFPSETVSQLEQRYGCPIVYFSGVVGGMMLPPSGRLKDATGKRLVEGEFEFATGYGVAVADLATKAISSAKPIELAPLDVSTGSVSIPLANQLYRLARVMGVVRRKGRLWTGDFHKIGPLLTAADAEKPAAVVTEVSCLRLGQMHIACVPGEIYPELVEGKFQDPIETNADFPKAPREPTITKIMPDNNWMLFGLANDEIGYIIPKTQWDQSPPFAYDRKLPQYGEINSCGPQAAPAIMSALVRRMNELHEREPVKQTSE